MKIIIAWYFMAASVFAYGAPGITTHGPFPTREACEQHAAWAKSQANDPKRHPVNVTACWSDR